ncbi:MAG: hypothetical protein JRJ85_14685 [Deltaproteobacteria bacterium]|nr:hypothetical protein [Deltaproteobacteria bacterium]
MKAHRLNKYFFPVIMLCLFVLAPVFGNMAEAGSATPKQVLIYHDQWQDSLHSNLKLANEINNGALKDPKGHDATCLKCHIGQGFLEWESCCRSRGRGFRTHKRGEAPHAKPVKTDTAVGTTCLTCHNPQKPDSPMLRFQGKLPKLQSGYAVNHDAGTGAICFLCHNSNRGLYNDATIKNPKHRAPHEPSQVDLIMGQNLFFVKVGEPSPHLQVENTCIGCHGGGKKPTNHSFHTSFKDCKACHDNMDAEKMRVNVVNEYNKLKAAVEKELAEFIQVGLDAGKFRVLHMYEDESEDKDYTTFTGGKVSGVNIRYFHGRQAVDLEINGKKRFAFINKLESNGINL